MILLPLFSISAAIATRNDSNGTAIQFLALFAVVVAALYLLRKRKAKEAIDEKLEIVESQNWITVTAISRVRRTDKSEAQLILHTETRTTSRTVNPRRRVGDNDASSFKTTFGFRKSERSTSIEIVWPSGLVEVFPNQGINQDVVLNEGMGERK